MLGVWIFFPMAEIVPSLKHVRLLDLPITKWVVIVYMMCGFYILSHLVYLLVRCLVTSVAHNESKLHIALALAEITDSLIFWLTEVMVTKRVPAFRQHEILGLNTQKWIEVSVLVVITLSTRVTMWSLRIICQMPALDMYIGNQLHKQYLVYGANGMRRSINFILSSLLLVLTWAIYFGSHLRRTDEGRHIWEFGKWTLICLLICSFLWLIKFLVLLTWEVRTVYDRLYSRILNISEQLYFLGILGHRSHDIFTLDVAVVHEEAETERNNINNSQRGRPHSCIIHKLLQNCCPATYRCLYKNQVDKKQLTARRREKVKNDFLKLKDENPTIDDVQQVAQYFLSAKTDLLLETYTSDILMNFDSSGNPRKLLKEQESLPTGYCASMINILIQVVINFWERISGGMGRGSSVTQHSNYGIWSNDWDDFVRMFSQNKADFPEISLIHIQTWVVRAHNNCMFLANTLSSAKEFAGCLNNVIGGILIGVSFILWLFLTGQATTKVLVLIASPLLAATFIFGNTCKTLFEGFFSHIRGSSF